MAETVHHLSEFERTVDTEFDTFSLSVNFTIIRTLIVLYIWIPGKRRVPPPRSREHENR